MPAGLCGAGADATGSYKDGMRKVNVRDVEELTWASPRGKFRGAGKQISEALGRIPNSTDFNERHPFDIEVARLEPGTTPYPFHSHSAQWEYYQVLSGSGKMRHDGGTESIRAGDAMLFKPGEAHAMSNDGTEDLVILVVADNPLGESHHFPDSGKWCVRSPERRYVRSEPLDYFDGEE